MDIRDNVPPVQILGGRVPPVPYGSTPLTLSENVGQLRDIFWSVMAPSWRVETFQSSLGAARHFLAYLRLPNSESRTSNQIIAAEPRGAVTRNSWYGKFLCTENLCEGPNVFTEQGLIGFKCDPGYTADTETDRQIHRTTQRQTDRQTDHSVGTGPLLSR